MSGKANRSSSGLPRPSKPSPYEVPSSSLPRASASSGRQSRRSALNNSLPESELETNKPARPEKGLSTGAGKQSRRSLNSKQLPVSQTQKTGRLETVTTNKEARKRRASTEAKGSENQPKRTLRETTLQGTVASKSLEKNRRSLQDSKESPVTTPTFRKAFDPGIVQFGYQGLLTQKATHTPASDTRRNSYTVVVSSADCNPQPIGSNSPISPEPAKMGGKDRSPKNKTPSKDSTQLLQVITDMREEQRKFQANISEDMSNMSKDFGEVTANTAKIEAKIEELNETYSAGTAKVETLLEEQNDELKVMREEYTKGIEANAMLASANAKEIASVQQELRELTKSQTFASSSSKSAGGFLNGRILMGMVDPIILSKCRRTVCFSRLPYKLGQSNEELIEHIRTYMETHMGMSNDIIDSIHLDANNVSRPLARLQKRNSQTELVCDTIQERNQFFYKASQVPLDCDWGRIYAKYPQEFKSLRASLELKAKAIRAFRRDDSSNVRFYAQIRYHDVEGVAIWVKKSDDDDQMDANSKVGWIQLEEAIDHYGSEDFPKSITNE